MKKLILFLILFLAALQSKSQEIIVTEPGDTLVVLTKKEVGVVNKAFIDLRYTKLELQASDSITTSLQKSLRASESIIELQDSQKKILEREIKNQKKNNIKTGLFSGGIGLLLGLIAGILL